MHIFAFEESVSDLIATFFCRSRSIASSATRWMLFFGVV
jgi:hypothetical protein